MFGQFLLDWMDVAGEAGVPLFLTVSDKTFGFCLTENQLRKISSPHIFHYIIEGK